jgi:hypothetical protein
MKGMVFLNKAKMNVFSIWRQKSLNSALNTIPFGH